jgi:aryl-alcohol dehydrogenase-like predicted oxidoreductase
MSPSRRHFLAEMTGAAIAVGCQRAESPVLRPKLEKRVAAAVTAPSRSPSAGSEKEGARKGPSAGTIPERRLGKTGVNVSMIGLGGFHIGKQQDETASIELIRSAVDAGITFLDNCWDYNDGQSEARMGKALADGYRQRVFLMTKLDGRTAVAATAQLEQSLGRLGTDVIDLVQIHEVIRDSDPRRAFEKGGVVHALIAAKQAGKLRFIGFTGHKDPHIHLAMLRAADQHGFSFDTVQMPLNVLDAHYRSFEHEVLPELVARDIGVLGMKSLADGKIVESGAASPQECIRYALSLPTSVVICGIDTPEVLAQNVDIARTFQPLAPTEKSALLGRTRAAADGGRYETFKTTHDHDGTSQHPHWLEEARI